MARRTNKTAHVLNLIAGSEDKDAGVYEADSIPESSVESYVEKNPSDYSPDMDSAKNSIETKVSNINEPNKHNGPAPTLEILFNDHDPLSDLVQLALEDIEDIDNSEKISTENELTPDNTVSAEYNSPDDNHSNHNEAPDFNETLDDTNTGTEDLPDDKDLTSTQENNSINDAATSDTDDLIVEKEKTPNTLLNELEKSNQLHCHDRKDLNSMMDLDFKYVNVYERIVQDKILSYMRKFDMCMCDRCIIDTFALTLTFLPTKIVVVNKDDIFPMISYYEAKNTAIISTALIKACMMVIDKPNH